jgi:hypothetical protein
MDTREASTEPFCRFHFFHEQFNRSTKVAFGALEALKQGDAPLTVLTTGDEPWGEHTKWRDPAREARDGIKFLSAMGIVRVMSAFEDFLITVEAEHSRTAFLRPAVAPPSDGADTEEAESLLTKVTRRLGWSTEPVVFATPLYDYFTVARNCIVHRSNRASPALIDLAESEVLGASHAAWPRREGTRLPKLPTINLGRDIPFQPRHAILASSVCYAIAKYLNRQLVDAIGESGLIYMAAHYSLLSDERVELKAKKSAEVVVRHMVVDRYRMKDVSVSDAVNALKQMDKWKACRLAYQRHYPDPLLRK